MEGINGKFNSIEDKLESVVDKIEAQYRGDINISVDKCYDGSYMLEVGEISEDCDYTVDYELIEVKRFENLEELVRHLEVMHL